MGRSSAGPAKVSSFLGGTSSLLKRSPIPASPTRSRKAPRVTPQLRLRWKPGWRACGSFVGGAGKSFVVSRRHLLSPQAFADPRLACAWGSTASPLTHCSEGSPVLREPALPASGAMDGGAQAASRERRPRRAGANARRRGTGDPEATRDSASDEAASDKHRQRQAERGARGVSSGRVREVRITYSPTATPARTTYCIHQARLL